MGERRWPDFSFSSVSHPSPSHALILVLKTIWLILRNRGSTSKPFLAVLTISSHQVTSCVESSIHLYYYLFYFNLASFKYETITYAIPHVSSTNFYWACFHIVHGNPTINKPLHKFHLHCCLMLELDYLYNNTSFWLSLSKCEITYYLSTLSKWVRSFNHVVIQSSKTH